MQKLPEQFCEMVASLEAMEPRVGGLVDALESTEPSVSIRLNRRKTPQPPLGAERVPWCVDGWYLADRPQFTLDPALHQGRYYVQDASSMFLGHVVGELTRREGPMVYLDACAAPGGKTTAAIDALPEGSLVVANEFDYRRAEILRENVIKWGYPSVVVSRGDTARFRRLRDTFDIIAADVPCSGEGMMRKDAEAVAQWSPGLVERCVERQREIIDNLWPALKPGGYLIYSTCTFNLRENEEMLRYIIDTHGAECLPIPGADGFDGPLPAIGDDTLHACRFMPHRSRGEGLFMALLRKRGERQPSAAPQKGGRPPRLAVKLPDWFPAGMDPLVQGDTLYAVEPRWRSTVEQLMRQLDVILPGVETATIKGRDLIPAQGVAMLAREAVPEDITTVEVDRPTALDYLRREAITLPEGTPRGFVLLTFGGLPLGWVKNLGNRCNNLYPQTWRIRCL